MGRTNGLSGDKWEVRKFVVKFVDADGRSSPSFFWAVKLPMDRDLWLPLFSEISAFISIRRSSEQAFCIC